MVDVEGKVQWVLWVCKNSGRIINAFTEKAGHKPSQDDLAKVSRYGCKRVLVEEVKCSR